MGAPARRKRSRRGRWLPLLGALLIAAAVAAAVVLLQRNRESTERRERAAVAFLAAWEQRDLAAMHALTDGTYDLPSFRRSYRNADAAAGTRAVRVGDPGGLDGGAVTAPVAVRTEAFGTLRGRVSVPTVDENGKGRVAWTPTLRLPGLRKGEKPVQRTGPEPRRGEILAANGAVLANDSIGAGIAGVPAVEGEPATGLERIYADRLTGHPSATLRFGERVIERVKAERGRDVRSTLSLRLSRVAENALGERVGGIAVVRPRNGDVLALGGLAVSAPQPPGSTFKIITLAGALQHKLTSPSESFPVRQYATLSGVRLYNASRESCGGSLAASFAESCNSVFAPMGAELGPKRLVAVSERFGFNQEPALPTEEPSQIVRKDLKDDLATGAAAIGQSTDLATPLVMASVGATIASGGVRARPRIVRREKVVRRRAVRRGVAATVRDMMVGVVQGGTGTAGGLPGISVAGKTGTAELASGSEDPSSTTAWFVAFAPAERPRVAVAVMLVGAGFGGTSAAPVARRVLAAAL